MSDLCPTPHAAQGVIGACSASLTPLSSSVVLNTAHSGSQKAMADLSGLGSKKGTLKKQEQAAGDEWSQVPVNCLM